MSTKVGFIGAGNMCQAIIGAWLEKKLFTPEQIWVANRTPGKLKKIQEQWPVNIANTNEELVDACDIVILAMKPQDFTTAIEPIGSAFRADQAVVSLAAGIRLPALKKIVPQVRKWV